MSEWQPIETAPKDGTLILAWDGCQHDICEWWDGSISGVRGPSERDAGWWIDNDRGEMKPTHWQPLPDPPYTPGVVR